MIQDGHKEPADVRRIMTWSCHGVSCLWMIAEMNHAIILLYPNSDVLRRGGYSSGGIVPDSDAVADLTA